MDAIAPKTRRSRFGNEPLLDQRGRPRVAVLSGNDEVILSFLARRRYATAEEIALITCGSIKWTRDRLNHLKSKPNCYVKVCDEQTCHRRAHQWNKLFYELNGPGVGHLNERGINVRRRERPSNFSHEIMTCQIM